MNFHRLIAHACLLTCMATHAITAPASAAAALSNAVAVVDFEMAAAQAGSEDWSFGLADVLAVELRKRGVHLFEREQIRLVLGEQRLKGSGLLQPGGTLLQLIPDLRFLVTGNIRSFTNRQFHLECSLVEARTGRIVSSYNRAGAYPAGIRDALADLANQLTSSLKPAGVAEAVEPGNLQSAALTPEVALLLYRGIAYCLDGRPEMGVTWFIDASGAAPGFLPARVWTMRAFEMLGLEDFAAVARARVREAPNGQGVLNRLDESRFFQQQLVGVAILPDPRLDAAGLQFAAALKAALAQSTNFFVADASNIRSLAAEMDLQLTEKGTRDLQTTSVLWSALDALVLVSADANSASGYSVQMRDALSGATLLNAKSGAGTGQVTDLARQLADCIRTRRSAMASDLNETDLKRHRAAKPVQVGNTDRGEFAGLLRFLAENPKDQPGWMRLALFFPWLGDRRYPCACFDRVLKATDLNTPDAAHWISEAIWHKWHRERPSSIALEAAVLLDRFPESPEAQYVRSALALEYIEQKRFSEAARILLDVGEKLPQLARQVKIQPDYWANYYFFAALALHETGDDVRARQFLDRAAAVLQENPDMLIHDSGTFQLGVWVNHFPERHPLFGPDRGVRQAVAEWQTRLQPVTKAAGNEMSAEELERMLIRVKQAPAAGAWSNRVVFLERLIEHKRRHPELYQGRITESVWKGAYRNAEAWPMGTMSGHFTLPGVLVMEAITLLHRMANDAPDRIEETRRLAGALAEKLNPPIAATCFEAVGEQERALQKVEEEIRRPSPFPKFEVGMRPTPQQMAMRELRRQKIRILQALGRPAEAAAYARAQASITTGDADEQLAAVTDAVNTCGGTGHSDEVAELWAGFVRSQEAAGAMTAQSAAARMQWAEIEIARNHLFEAMEILRAVVKGSEGRGWGFMVRKTGYTKVYNAALARLAELRVVSQFPVVSTDWAQPPRPSEKPEVGEATDLERELEVLLRGTGTGSNERSYGGPAVGVFIRKYGRAAIPAALEAARRGEFQARMISLFGILDRTATPADAPQILEAFKVAPQLAPVAFKLDPTNASTILRERFGIYGDGRNIPSELVQVVEQQRLVDQYPVVIANFAARELNGALAPQAATLDRMLQRDPTLEALRAFRRALASVLQRQLLSSFRYGLETIGEIAARHGVPEGIEALLRSGDGTSTNCVATLSKYLDLPKDPKAARAAAEAGLGRWQWDDRTKQFHQP